MSHLAKTNARTSATDVTTLCVPFYDGYTAHIILSLPGLQPLSFLLMTLCSDLDYAAALREFETLARESEVLHYARLLELRDAIDAYEIAQGHEPEAASSGTT